MRRAAGAGHDDLEPAPAGRLGIVEKTPRGAMGRYDPRLIGNSELIEDIGGMTHGRPVGLAPHDDADEGDFIGHALIALQKMARKRAHYPARRRPAQEMPRPRRERSLYVNVLRIAQAPGSGLSVGGLQS